MPLTAMASTANRYRPLLSLPPSNPCPVAGSATVPAAPPRGPIWLASTVLAAVVVLAGRVLVAGGVDVLVGTGVCVLDTTVLVTVGVAGVFVAVAVAVAVGVAVSVSGV